MTALLEVQSLRKYFAPSKSAAFRRSGGAVKALDGVSFSVAAGETLGVVGESGCGKSTLARCLMRLLEPTSGTILLDGRDITHLSDSDLRPLRREFTMIFQDPYASLNPRKRISFSIAEGLRTHTSATDAAVTRRVQELLEIVGLSPEHYDRFPHEFSGGQRQRIGIARALAVEPRLLICDEPVSALDVSIQAQILNLLSDLKVAFALTVVFIAHDLTVVRNIADRVMVMYLGQVVEIGERDILYSAPKHPYTGALLSAVPIANPKIRGKRSRIVLEGDVPSPSDVPPGCRFHPRCPRASPGQCDVREPQLESILEDHQVACHFPLERWPMRVDEMSTRG